MKTKNYNKPLSLFTRKQLKRGIVGNVPMAFCNSKFSAMCKKEMKNRVMLKNEFLAKIKIGLAQSNAGQITKYGKDEDGYFYIVAK